MTGTELDFSFDDAKLDGLLAHLESGFGGPPERAAAAIRHLRAERDEARAYEAKARIRENMADEARVSASLRASKAEAEVERLRGLLREAPIHIRDDWYAQHDQQAHDDAVAFVARIDAAIAEDKP